MAETLNDLDESLLEEVGTAMGTATTKDTVVAALKFTAEATRARRQQALAELRRIADEGGFDFDRLDELDQ
jgi:hypothetical protein